MSVFHHEIISRVRDGGAFPITKVLLSLLREEPHCSPPHAGTLDTLLEELLAIVICNASPIDVSSIVEPRDLALLLLYSTTG